LDKAEDIPALAARYRAAAHTALGLVSGDSVVYGGAGPIGCRIAFEMAAHQQRAAAAADTAIAERGVSPTAAARAWEAGCPHGEPEPAGLLLVEGTVGGQPDVPLPPDRYALYSVARDEAYYAAAAGTDPPPGETSGDGDVGVDAGTDEGDARDAATRTAAAVKAVSLAGFTAGLRHSASSRGTVAPEEVLERAGRVHRCAGTPQSDWDERVNRALHVTQRGLRLARQYAPEGDGASNVRTVFDGPALLVMGTQAGRAAPQLRARAADHCPQLRTAHRPLWDDPLAPPYADELAALVADVLFPKSSRNDTGKRTGNPG